MSDDLHESHRWGERAFEEGRIPFCLDCHVDGFEDEPAAFQPCPPKKKADGPLCWKTYVSIYIPGHTHLCETAPHTGDHICAECGRRFGTR